MSSKTSDTPTEEHADHLAQTARTLGAPTGDSYSSEDPNAIPHPRLIEEHHVIGPHGEDEIEATDERGRRWYQLRPEQRRRYDFVGFNWTWWVVIWVLFVFMILPWGGAWHY